MQRRVNEHVSSEGQRAEGGARRRPRWVAAWVASVGATLTMRPSTSRTACERPTMFSNL